MKEIDSVDSINDDNMPENDKKEQQNNVEAQSPQSEQTPQALNNEKLYPEEEFRDLRGDTIRKR